MLARIFGNMLPAVMHSQGDVHTKSTYVRITKTSTTEAISLTTILYRILLLSVHYRITYGYVMNLNGFTHIRI